jgi:hypothetical protein
MFHPSSGHTNFNVVTGTTKDTSTSNQLSVAAKQDQNPSHKEIETKTKDAINDAVKSQSTNNKKS